MISGFLSFSMVCASVFRFRFHEPFMSHCGLTLYFPSLDDHGKWETAVIQRSEATADIVVKFLQAGHNDPIAAHPGNDFRHRMSIIGKGL